MTEGTDPSTMRAVLGHFPSGVTIVTGTTPEGPAGLHLSVVLVALARPAAGARAAGPLVVELAEDRGDRAVLRQRARRGPGGALDDVRRLRRRQVRRGRRGRRPAWARRCSRARPPGSTAPCTPSTTAATTSSSSAPCTTSARPARPRPLRVPPRGLRPHARSASERTARRRPGPRARHDRRRPVRGAAARRLRRRRRQDRAAGPARTRMRDWGQESYRGHRLWWTVHARNKRCITLDLRAERGQELFLAPGRGRRRRRRELPSRHPRALEPRLGPALGGQPGARARAGVGLRADRAVRGQGRLRLGGRGALGPAVHQRLPGGGAAADGDLAGRLAGGDGRRPGRARRAAPQAR